MTISGSIIINFYLLDFTKSQYIFKIRICLSQHSEIIHIKDVHREILSYLSINYIKTKLSLKQFRSYMESSITNCKSFKCMSIEIWHINMNGTIK